MNDFDDSIMFKVKTDRKVRLFRARGTIFSFYVATIAAVAVRSAAAFSQPRQTRHLSENRIPLKIMARIQSFGVDSLQMDEIYGRERLRRFESNDSNNAGEGDSPTNSNSDQGAPKQQQKGKTSSGRVGGRKPSTEKQQQANNGKETKSFLSKWKANTVLPVLAALFLVKALLGSLFGSGGQSGTYVYYQSSVYETRSYGPDGQVETSRKESVRSNIPSLINSQRDEDGRPSVRTNLPKGNPDADFNRFFF